MSQDKPFETKPFQLDAKALQVARHLAEDPTNHGKKLRLYLCGKDCDGYLYGVNFDDIPEPGDLAWEQDGLTCVADPSVQEVCQNAQVTYVNDDRGQGFLVENPAHSKFKGKYWRGEADDHDHHDH